MNMNERTSAKQFSPDEEKFFSYLEKLPEEEQLAVTLIGENIVNGCSWEFVRDRTKLRRMENQFNSNPNVSLIPVYYHHGGKSSVQGYLVYMKLDYLLKTLNAASSVLITPKDAKIASEKRQAACVKLAKLMQKGYSGRIGIYCTNNTDKITIDSRTFDAYAVTFAEFCQIAVKMNYGIKHKSGIASAQECMKNASKLIAECEVAPSSNALLMDIAPLKASRR